MSDKKDWSLPSVEKWSGVEEVVSLRGYKFFFTITLVALVAIACCGSDSWVATPIATGILLLGSTATYVSWSRDGKIRTAESSDQPNRGEELTSPDEEISSG